MELMMSPDTVEQRQFSADVVFLTSSHCHDPWAAAESRTRFDPTALRFPNQLRCSDQASFGGSVLFGCSARKQQTLPMQLSKMEFSLQVVDGPRDR
ncbi:hypothetical protein INR49_018300 [Caranx melampygus]|nr:hypothetical protein INR49_018300 [Caranx melampygus]